MRLLSLLVLVAALPSCRCNKEEPRPVDEAPTTSASSTVEVAPPSEVVEWSDATNSPSKVRKLCGKWGDKKPWADLDCVLSWDEDHPDAGAWPYPFTEYLNVHADTQVECGFYSDKMGTAYCLYPGSSERKIVPLKLEFWDGKVERRVRITVGENQPVVVVRHATP